MICNSGNRKIKRITYNSSFQKQGRHDRSTQSPDIHVGENLFLTLATTMKNLSDKQAEIIQFFDGKTEEEQLRIIEEVRQYSEVQTVEDFKAEFRALFEQKNLSGIGVIYEAISKNTHKWSDLYLEEFERGFQAASQSPSPFEVLESLEELCYPEKENVKTQDEIIQLLGSYLNHEKPALRFKAIWYLGDWITENIKEKHSNLIQKIKQMLKSDSNWRVRYVASLILIDWKEFPKNHKSSLIHKLKIRFLNPFDMQ